MVQKAAQILTAHPKHFHLHNLIKSIPIVREKKTPNLETTQSSLVLAELY